MPVPKVVTRFAPSPTGYLHVGGARTALFCWLLARHCGGEFLLRIEDTDLARSTEQATVQLLDDLRWLGLNWDNPQLVHQSQRTDVYNRLIDDLMARGLAYEAWETPQELAALRQEAEKQKRAFIYQRRNYSTDQLAQFAAQGRKAVVRFATPVQPYSFHDAVLDKDITQPIEEVQDFVIRKADGMPTYHFAVVVDDAEMGVTHVLRGQEHTKNTFLHLALQKALGYAQPVYAHLPVIQNLDGSKMGKRDRDKKVRERAQVWLKTHQKTVDDLATAAALDAPGLGVWIKDSKTQLDLDQQQAVMQAIHLKESELPEILVNDFRRQGYLPEVLLNFLALLGWSPGEDRERMSIGEMVRLFELKDIGKSNAKFSRDKLLSFNTDAVAEADPNRLIAAFRDYLSVNPASPLTPATDAQLAELLDMKKGFRLLREVDELSRFLFVPDDQIDYQPQAVEKVLKKENNQGASVLRDLRQLLEGSATWEAGALEQQVQSYCSEKNLALGKVAQPLRVAVCGSTVSPPIFHSLAFLGRNRTLARIDRCLTILA
ncbi:MAG: glutamate--tRNA ligase [Phycisphaerales bacterium]|nr:glutamate--tRNA ligase [Phycisphaerales bacterium]